MTHQKLKTLIPALAFVSAVLASSSPAIAQDACHALFTKASASAANAAARVEPRKLTKIEAEFPPRLRPLSASEQLSAAIERLRETNPDLAAKVTEARRKKDGGVSLKLDLSALPTHMVFFVEGTYKKVLGSRGVSEPFVQIRALDNDTMVIQHEGDRYPLMVKWSESATNLRRAYEATINGQIHRVLEIPSGMRSERALAHLPKKYIYSLISASRLNKFISSAGSLEMQIASLLHEGQLTFDRPTQEDSKNLRALLDTDSGLRRMVRTLLFVAPTATGKTRILGDAIVSKMKGALAMIQANPRHTKKLTVLMTKTPDLTSELAREIGTQLYNKMGPRNYRIIQWGGTLSETGALSELPALLEFIEKSDVPVILVTSYPTLGARVSTEGAMQSLFARANSLNIDEAHNSTGQTFERVMNSARAVAEKERVSGDILNSLDILGVTASPVGVTRSIELFDAAFWASIDTPTSFARRLADQKERPWAGPNKDVLEYKRIMDQYQNARDRGEINAPDESIHYRPEERGFSFNSIFKRVAKGTAPTVDIEKLKEIWPDVAEMIKDHGPGVIHTYPRDAESVAETLSALTGKNYVSLQKLSAEDRAEVYEAFRTGQPLGGKRIDAIVGTIREGLDFPRAGWYVSLKKYVKFPENIQGPGRVVRLALDKLPPVIIFFGQEVDRITYEKVRDMILRKMGRLPHAIQNGRLYKGARRADMQSSLGKTIEDLNTGMEVVMRIRADLAKALGDPQKPNAEAVATLQEFVRTSRLPHANREVADAVNRFMYEVNSYPFFKGTLETTWKYCTSLLTAAKKGPHSRMKSEDLAILQDAEMMERVKEFRDMYAWLGSVPRAVLATMELKPKNLHELAKAVDVFVANNERAPYATSEDPMSLAKLTTDAMTRPNFVEMLSNESRMKLEALAEQKRGETFEQTLESEFRLAGRLPEFSFDELSDTDRNVADSNSDRLALRLIEYMKTGELNVASLAHNRSLLTAIDSQASFERLAKKLHVAVDKTVRDLIEEEGGDVTRLHSSGMLTYDALMSYEEFGVMKVIKQLAAQGQPNSLKYRQMIEELLRSHGF